MTPLQGKVRVALVVMAAAALLAPAGAAASQGVAVDVGRIDVDEPLRGGQRYALPSVGVRNPGTETARYRFFARGWEDSGQAAAADWFEVSPIDFTLEPGQKRRVEVSLRLPSGIPTGTYEALLTAQLAGAEGVSVGAAAATRVTFTVGEAGSGAALPSLAWGLVLLASVTIAARVLGRRPRAAEDVPCA